MAGSGPQQTSPPHVESVNVDQQDELHNPEWENHVDNQREGSSRTIHVGRSGYDEGAIWFKSTLMKRVCNDN